MIYNIELEIEAANPVELNEKLQSFQDLQDNLDHEDLVKASEVIVHHPEVVEFIKDVAPPEGQKLGWTDYLKIAKKAFQKFG